MSDFADIFCLGEYLREIDTLFENTLAYEYKINKGQSHEKTAVKNDIDHLKYKKVFVFLNETVSRDFYPLFSLF